MNSTIDEKDKVPFVGDTKNLSTGKKVLVGIGIVGVAVAGLLGSLFCPNVVFAGTERDEEKKDDPPKHEPTPGELLDAKLKDLEQENAELRKQIRETEEKEYRRKLDEEG